MNYINKSDLTRRLNIMLHMILKYPKCTKLYETECKTLKLNLTKSGEVRYSVGQSLTTRQLLHLFDIIIDIMKEVNISC